VKASALVEQLRAAIAEHGDLEVIAPDGLFGYYGSEFDEPVTGLSLAGATLRIECDHTPPPTDPHGPITDDDLGEPDDLSGVRR
jgi:hypothetical protein